MKCSKCGLRLVRAQGDQWVCFNKKCERYAGADLSNPIMAEPPKAEK